MRSTQPSFLVAFCLYLIIFPVASSSPFGQKAASSSVQAEQVRELLERLKVNLSSQFHVDLDEGYDDDEVHVSKDQSVVVVKASSGTMAAWGIHHYLKYHVGAHFSWDTRQTSTIDLSSLPMADFRLRSNEKFRYYQNVCTPGYTFAFWRWPQWEEHIDWMALNGINAPLAFAAQEAIWIRVYEKFGITRKELDQHFAGPAFLPWQRMGNMEAFGGPLPPQWHANSVELQHKILQRMRNLGMTPVLPAFAGHVPKALIEKNPSVNFTKQAWNGFAPTYLLDANEPLFQEIGSTFIREYRAEFGTDHLYNCDTFNEMDPPTTDPDYIRQTGKAIYNAMASEDEEAVWMMQGWLFSYGDFWQEPQIRAILSSVPSGKMIVLDLDSTYREQYSRTRSYYGLQPFVFNDLSNFGGSLGLFGRFDNINQRPFEARSMQNSTMIGIGFTPEGLTDSYITTELMSEMAWRDAPVGNLTEWISAYLSRRYGKSNLDAQKAFHILSRKVLNSKVDHFNQKVLMVKMPSLNMTDFTWYPWQDLLQAWDYLMKARQDLDEAPGFVFDLVDVSRQCLANLLGILYEDAMEAYRGHDYARLHQIQSNFLSVLADMDEMLGSHEMFLLGRWLKMAREVVPEANDKDKALYEYNARNQVTLWGPNGEILDYAAKQWSGLIRDYYLPRWKLFFDYLLLEIIDPDHFTYQQEVFRNVFMQDIGIPFTFDHKTYPSEPEGDTINLVENVYFKWRPFIEARTSSDIVIDIIA